MAPFEIARIEALGDEQRDQEETADNDGANMMEAEGSEFDRKSLRLVMGRTADWDEVVKDAVAFANAKGGRLAIGIEDNDNLPPAGQRINAGLPDLARRRIKELTSNVDVVADVKTAANGGEYLEIRIPRSGPVASTSSGRYFLRVADASRPVLGNDVMRLAGERAALPWETQIALGVSRQNVDEAACAALIGALRASDRVKASVKEKSDAELLDHYLLTIGESLTNLGVLCVGRREDRARLGTAPVVQAIKYDEQGKKVSKWAWDDYSLSPIELIEQIWRDIPDFKERYELPDGLYRQYVPVYDEKVVRELLVNAFAHRPYTQGGDIFLNLHPDRLEIVNPGLLPLGVTPKNILHASVRRNENLARLLHDLKLMEREGSGFDLMYEIMLAHGQHVPELREGPDRVEVVIHRRILKAAVIDLLAKADEAFHLSQRERICLGLIAQQETLTAIELTKQLELSRADDLGRWLGRLKTLGIVSQRGRTKATEYFVEPAVLRKLDFKGKTSLRGIESHRLRELILKDLDTYRKAGISQIHKRIGSEIPRAKLRNELKFLLQSGKIAREGQRRGVVYLWTDSRNNS